MFLMVHVEIMCNDVTCMLSQSVHAYSLSCILSYSTSYTTSNYSLPFLTECLSSAPPLIILTVQSGFSTPQPHAMGNGPGWMWRPGAAHRRPHDDTACQTRSVADGQPARPCTMGFTAAYMLCECACMRLETSFNFSRVCVGENQDSTTPLSLL